MSVSHTFQERDEAGNLKIDVLCLSTDTKPPALPESRLVETDTGRVFIHSAGQWIEALGVRISSVRLSANLPTLSTNALANATGLFFALQSGITYGFQFFPIFRTHLATNGIKLGLTFPAAVMVTANVRIPVAADGVSGEFQGWITSSGDSVIGSGVQSTGTNYLAEIFGTIRPSANGNLQVQYASELTASTSAIMQESYGILTVIP